VHVEYEYHDLSFKLFSDSPDIIDPEKQEINESLLILTPETDQWGKINLCLLVSDPNSLTTIWKIWI